MAGVIYRDIDDHQSLSDNTADLYPAQMNGKHEKRKGDPYTAAVRKIKRSHIGIFFQLFITIQLSINSTSTLRHCIERRKVRILISDPLTEISIFP